jgi:hypothetical protein
MKKAITLVVALSFLFVGCAAHTHVIGSGAQGSDSMSQRQFYLFSLWPVGSTADSESMAAGASNYTINTQATFVDGLIGAVTLGILAPRTVTVTK